ncbi:hypothetical protein GCM10007918_00850 [Piscinibacter gummiphilus]|nr:hypothetical protein GCM10007918_00850 [Piscinibacter gummiphilus]
MGWDVMRQGRNTRKCGGTGIHLQGGCVYDVRMVPVGADLPTNLKTPGEEYNTPPLEAGMEQACAMPTLTEPLLYTLA